MWIFIQEQILGMRWLNAIIRGLLSTLGADTSLKIGVIIHNWIPESWIETALGGKNPLGVILATIVSIPMYADIFDTIPITVALLSKGALLGTILSFLMAVITLSLPALMINEKIVSAGKVLKARDIEKLI